MKRLDGYVISHLGYRFEKGRKKNTQKLTLGNSTPHIGNQFHTSNDEYFFGENNINNNQHKHDKHDEVANQKNK